jgi:hypothetical protein
MEYRHMKYVLIAMIPSFYKVDSVGQPPYPTPLTTYFLVSTKSIKQPTDLIGLSAKLTK